LSTDVASRAKLQLEAVFAPCRKMHCISRTPPLVDVNLLSAPFSIFEGGAFD
jgi:hypothetical protein